MFPMKRELSVEREASDEKLVKRLKLEKAPVFRKKGHEKQYLHNEEVKLKRLVRAHPRASYSGENQDLTGGR